MDGKRGARLDSDRIREKRNILRRFRCSIQSENGANCCTTENYMLAILTPCLPREEQTINKSNCPIL
jgi:hypothetical protein